MQEIQRTVHSKPVDGEYKGICAVSPAALLVYEETNATTKPVINRHGNVIRPETRSFLPGEMPHSLAGFTFRSKCQMRASEGTLYRKIFISSADAEKPPASCAAEKNAPAEPEKKRIIYRMINSVYIPIFLTLHFYVFYFYIIINNYELISKKRGKYW